MMMIEILAETRKVTWQDGPKAVNAAIEKVDQLLAFYAEEGRKYLPSSTPEEIRAELARLSSEYSRILIHERREEWEEEEIEP